ADEIAGEPGIGTVERRKAQHNARARAAGEPLRRSFGIDQRAVQSHGCERGALVDPRLAAVRIGRRKRFLMNRVAPPAIAASTKLADATRRMRSFSAHAPGRNMRQPAGRWVARLMTASCPATAR